MDGGFWRSSHQDVADLFNRLHEVRPQRFDTGLELGRDAAPGTTDGDGSTSAPALVTTRRGDRTDNKRNTVSCGSS
jgi:hypothetical protein